MQIRFHFNVDKALDAMAYFLDKLGTTDKAKLTKLVFLADREHFIRHGVPVTGDCQCAMKYGPVPSSTLDVLNGEYPGASSVFDWIHVNDFRVELRSCPPPMLSETEIASIKNVIAEHGHKGTWDLVRETHRLPEYVESFVEGTSKPIPYERIAKFSGDESRFRLDRAVISAETAAHMTCPFSPDPDL